MILKSNNCALPPSERVSLNCSRLGLSFTPVLAGIVVSGLFAYSSLSQAQILEEVMVTAQKRAENSQDVPIAITALGENFLEDTGVTGSDGLMQVTPGLNFGRQLAAAIPFIRGVGSQNAGAGQDGSVSTYVDGVYYSSLLGSVLSFNNIERIEVLKGPQGTLFGRNATGGLMHIITKDPSGENGGQVELSYGSFDTLGLDVYADMALTESVATNLSVFHADQAEGYGVNIATGNDTNQTEELVIRNKWLVDVNDATSFKFSVDYSDVSSSTGVSQQIAPGALGVDGAAIFGGLVAGGEDPATAAVTAAGLATRNTGDFYNINSSVDPYADIEQWGASLRFDHAFENFDLVSITAYRDSDEIQVIAQDQTPVPNLLDVSLDSFNKTFTQELQLVSSGDGLEWIVGLFYLSGKAGYDTLNLSGGLMSPLSSVETFSEQETESIAVFAQFDYDISDVTTATVGIRYTADERSINGQTDFYAAGAPAGSQDFDESERFSEPSWRLALSHDLTDTTLVYGSYNRGYNGGVYNTIVTDGNPQSVEPEILDAYEMGAKSDFFDNKLRLNLSGFYYEFQDLQVSISKAGGNETLNAAEATMYGAEFELIALVSESLSIHSGVSLLTAEYDSFSGGPQLTPTGFGANSQSSGDFAGNDVPRSPKHTFNFGAVYDVVTEAGLVSASINYYYNDGFYWESENRLEQESYSVVNAQLGWESQDEAYYAQLFANNLLDEEYNLFGISSELGDYVSAAAPRTYGVRVGMRF